jgi:hypothetical protein
VVAKCSLGQAFLRCTEVSIAGRFLLACVDEAVAASAAKPFTGGIKHRCTAPAVAADEPMAPTTEPDRVLGTPIGWAHREVA